MLTYSFVMVFRRPELFKASFCEMIIFTGRCMETTATRTEAARQCQKLLDSPFLIGQKIFSAQSKAGFSHAWGTGVRATFAL